MSAELAIVALDVDGTLYDGHGVDPAAVSAIRAAADLGHTFVIVTGRPWRAAACAS